ncbi:MAG: MarC family NAAT transporter [Candidatus Omnitrophica bacterium]|nr:MarC family NAAT transporter [Candidatus Omnitrophota bacterium]
MSLDHVIPLLLGTIFALLPIANPVSTAAFFLGITKGDSAKKRNQQATMGCIYMFWILVAFLIAGSLIMEFFGISIPGLRIAGGLMVCNVGVNMLNPKDDGMKEESKQECRKKSDISFTPLAMPSLSGPGAIAVTIGLAAEIDHVFDYVIIIVGILIVTMICYAVLRASSMVVKFFGVAGVDALSRIMGFLLLCVGVQFILNGIIGVVTDPEIMQNIISAIKSE